jgi:DNA polymerase I-like protein with 3'-5' exonuclease and polymerase domains
MTTPTANQAVTELALAIAHLTPNWPAAGGRHNAYLALAGGLLRDGQSVERVEEIVGALAAATADQEAAQRVGLVKGTGAKQKARKPTTGWTKLATLLGASGQVVVSQFRHLLGLTVTLAGLAEAKRLPVEFLQGLGLRDRQAGGVDIPYRDAGGKVVATRVRKSLCGPQKLVWSKGQKALLYGEDRLAEAAAADDYLILTEGESNCWAAWHHSLPAAGVPGSGCARVLGHGHVTPFRRLLVLQDPDQAGAAFVTGVANRLAELNWQGDAQVVTLGTVKDLADLHALDPGGFLDAWQAAVERAVPLPPGAPKAARLDTLLEGGGPAPYQPFPVGALPAPLSAFVREGAAALGCDPSYLALPVLAVAASLIGNTRTIRLKFDWDEPSVIWAAIVGDSGTLKSPALKLVMGPLYRMQRGLVEEFRDDQQQYRLEKEQHERNARQAKRDSKDFTDPPPEAPKLIRLVTGDVTIEKLAEMLEDNPRGLLVCQDELGGWLNSFQRYKGKGGGSDLPRWLGMHRAETLIVDRKTGDRPTLFVPRAAVSVCGGIQPGTLGRALTAEHSDAGMVARLLMGMPPKTRKRWSEDEVDPDTRRQYEEVLAGLLRLQFATDDSAEKAPVALRLTPDAKAVWIAFYGEWARHQADAEGELAAALSKLEGAAARFALVHHVVTCVWLKVDDHCEVGVKSIEAGAELARWFAYEARRIYSTVRESEEERRARRLVEFIRSHGGRMTARRLHLANTSRYRTTEEAEAALQALAEAGQGDWVDLPPGPKGGRPSRTLQLRDDTTCFKSYETPDGGEDEDGDGGDLAATKRPTKPPPAGENSQQTDGFVGSEACSTHPGGAKPGPEEHPGSEGGGEVSLGEAEAALLGPGAAGGRGQPGGGWVLVRDRAELSAVVQAVAESRRVGLDIETVGLNPRQGRARLLQLATDRGLWVLDLFALGDVSDLWGPLAEAEVVVHNATFDLAFLWRLGFRPGRVCDLMVLSRLLTAGTREGNALADLAARELGVALDKSHQRDDWSAAQLSLSQLEYAARDARVTRDLYDRLTEKVRQAGMAAVAEIESRATPAFVWLAASGAPFDPGAWGALAAEAEGRERDLVERLDGMAPPRDGCLIGAGAWNWNSDDQVRLCFAGLGFDLESTGDEVLAGVEHPLAAALREHRSAAQMVKSFGRKWLGLADGGRIYAGWVPLGTDAGRSACKRPNLQQVPRDVRYRHCFRAPEGRVLLKADYSQLQLRIAAKIAKEGRMLEAYARGEDLHTLTARSITGKAEVTKADRQLAKAVNFGLLFGLGSNGLRSYAKREYGLDLTPEQAVEYKRAFFGSYPGLARWHRAAGRSTAKESRTILGRRRLLDDNTPYTHRLNSPVQGSEADGAKQAMALLWERRGQCPGAFPVLFVHDEIVVEAEEGQADAAAAWLKQAMEDGMAGVLDPVPCEVEVKVGQTWGG